MPERPWEDQIPPVLRARHDLRGQLDTLNESESRRHQVTEHEQVVVDEPMRLITGPCYMLESTIGQIFRGAEAVVARRVGLL